MGSLSKALTCLYEGRATASNREIKKVKILAKLFAHVNRWVHEVIFFRQVVYLLLI